jgi:hypothetical protein
VNINTDKSTGATGRNNLYRVANSEGCGLEDRVFESRQEMGVLFTTVSSPALGPAQPPIQRLPGALSLGVKRPGREADHSRPSSAEVKE